MTLDAATGFGLVVSYNPGYQSVLKDPKDSTRQRMVAIEFGFPATEAEEGIVTHEAGVDQRTATELVRFGQAIRRLEAGGLREVASTRVLIAAGRLIDDVAVSRGLHELIDLYLGPPASNDSPCTRPRPRRSCTSTGIRRGSPPPPSRTRGSIRSCGTRSWAGRGRPVRRGQHDRAGVAGPVCAGAVAGADPLRNQTACHG